MSTGRPFRSLSVAAYTQVVQRLIATYTVDLAAPYVFETPQTTTMALSPEDCRMEVEIDGHEVVVQFSQFSGSAHGRKDGVMFGEITQVTIAISRTETTDPPARLENSSSLTDDPRYKYFAERGAEYRRVLDSVMENLTTYIRYRAGHPLVDATAYRAQPGVDNPRWTDETGKEIRSTINVISSDWSPALRLTPRTRLKPYTPNRRDEIVAALRDAVEVSFRDELLAQARDVLSEKKISRAVLELAIACEVGVKQHYFVPSSAADAAFSYLEDKNRSNLKVLDLVGNVAKAAYGRSLRDEHPEAYRKIDYLFRCRNKVAHRGLAKYRDDNADEHTADFNTVIEWWEAVAECFDWLDQVS